MSTVVSFGRAPGVSDAQAKGYILVTVVGTQPDRDAFAAALAYRHLTITKFRASPDGAGWTLQIDHLPAGVTAEWRTHTIDALEIDLRRLIADPNITFQRDTIQ